MKKIFLSLIVFTASLLMCSCEIDNYDGPNASLNGIIYGTNDTPLQMEQGSGSGRLRMDEISWSDNPVPLYWNVRQDGSYINNKVFSGTYVATPVEGGFYPVVGDTITVSGNTTHDFHVVPYLDVEWVGEPQLLPDNKVTATFRFKRNAGPNGEAMPNLLDYQLFISPTKYVGNNNFETTRVGTPVTVANNTENTDITISSVQPMKYETTYYIRIGVRVNDTYKKYNYSTIKTITVPTL